MLSHIEEARNSCCLSDKSKVELPDSTVPPSSGCKTSPLFHLSLQVNLGGLARDSQFTG